MAPSFHSWLSLRWSISRSIWLRLYKKLKIWLNEWRAFLMAMRTRSRVSWRTTNTKSLFSASRSGCRRMEKFPKKFFHRIHSEASLSLRQWSIKQLLRTVGCPCLSQCRSPVWKMAWSLAGLRWNRLRSFHLISQWSSTVSAIMHPRNLMSFNSSLRQVWIAHLCLSPQKFCRGRMLSSALK